MDTSAEPGTVPNNKPSITLCTVRNLILIESFKLMLFFILMFNYLQ